MVSSVYICPLASSSIIEASRYYGSHSAVCYDDLSKHAISYRQLCLFLKKPAGREAFPSDIFFVHARILERSCNLASSQSTGSTLCLPVIETLQNDLSAYIATNVVSITDGQIYCDTALFGSAQCPAVSLERSVSRVGAKSLPSLFRLTSFGIYSILSEYKQGRLEYKNRYIAIQSQLVQRTSAWIGIEILPLISAITYNAASIYLVTAASVLVASIFPAAYPRLVITAISQLSL